MNVYDVRLRGTCELKKIRESQTLVDTRRVHEDDYVLYQDASLRAALRLGLRGVLGGRPRLNIGRRNVVEKWGSGRRPYADGRVRLRRRIDFWRDRSVVACRTVRESGEGDLSAGSRTVLAQGRGVHLVFGYRHDGCLRRHVRTREAFLFVDQQVRVHVTLALARNTVVRLSCDEPWVTETRKTQQNHKVGSTPHYNQF